MNYQKINLMLKSQFTLNSVFLSRLDGNDNVTECLGIYISVFSFLQRKGKNIGGLISPQILFIQFFNIFIISERDADFFIRAIKNFQNF